MSTPAGASYPLVADPRQPQHHTTRSRSSSAGRGGWSFKIAEVRGIGLYVHGTFLILLAWIALSHVIEGHGAAATVEGVLFMSSVFGIVVLVGELLTMRRAVQEGA